MNEPFILCIETALAIPSVAVCRGESILSEITLNEKQQASEKLHTVINDAVQSAGIRLQQLDAVAVSGGPGSYTGLRIGVAAAKGICYATDLPLIHIETMQALLEMAKMQAPEDIRYYIALLDARRNDAFMAVMDHEGHYIQTPEVVTLHPDIFEKYILSGKTLIFGNAVHKYIHTQAGNFFNIHLDYITAGSMAVMANSKYFSTDFVDLAYYEPNYYKEVYIAKKN